MQAKERDSNFELLRIYSMVLITANHIVNLGVLAKPPGQETLPWLSGGTFNKMLALILTQSSHKQLSLKHLLDKDFKSYLPLIMQQLTFSPAYDSLWIQ